MAISMDETASSAPLGSPGPLVLLSGASRGLGAAMAHDLVRRGYRLASFSRARTAAIEALEQDYSGRFCHYQVDMADADAVEAMVKRIEAEQGPISHLINNAGLAREGVLAVAPTSDIEELIGVNLTGSLLLTRQTARSMLRRPAPLAQGGRSILFMSSIIAHRGYAGLSAYAATKAALEGAARALARELGGRGVRVNCIAPGYIDTDMTSGLDEGQRRQIIRRTPLGRLGRPEDIVGTVAFLLSDAARFITGQTIIIDGGITC
jgi:3-oxoacyl-[acyl-carrier protein] reductase